MHDTELFSLGLFLLVHAVDMDRDGGLNAETDANVVSQL